MLLFLNILNDSMKYNDKFIGGKYNLLYVLAT